MTLLNIATQLAVPENCPRYTLKASHFELYILAVDIASFTGLFVAVAASFFATSFPLAWGFHDGAHITRRSVALHIIIHVIATDL